MEKEYITVKEIIEELGVSKARVYDLIRRRRIKPERVLTPYDRYISGITNTKFIFTRQEIERYKKEKEGYKAGSLYYHRPPVYKDAILEWKQQHPYCSKYACAKELGVCYQTVCKWWDFSPASEEEQNQ